MKERERRQRGWYVQKRKSQKGCRDLPQEDSNFPVFFWWALADKDKVIVAVTPIGKIDFVLFNPFW